MSAEKTARKDKALNDRMRILKIWECPSVSARSVLSYEVGCKNGKDVYFRVVGNSGTGIFNKDWVAWAEIETLLSMVGAPITSGRFKKLAVGKSANTPGFIAAVLISEGLLAVSKDNLRHFDRLDPSSFLAEIKKLVEADSSPPSPVAAKETKPKASKVKAGEPT